MRNWSRAYRRASFRGVRFWVDEDGDEVGRRVAVHNISGGEMPVTEDLGRLPTAFDVRAYVASDRADSESAALKAVCALPGASLLTLPLAPASLVRCLVCRRNRRRDTAGYIAFDLSFVEAGLGGAVGAATGLSALRLSFGANLGPASLGLSIGLDGVSAGVSLGL